MKKCISLLLAAILMLSNAFVVSANTNGSMENFRQDKTYEAGQFIDVTESDWYAENVKMAYELSLVNGTSDITFSPEANLTIAQAITLASRLNNTYYGNTYSFVVGDIWYQTYVDYAIQKGIIKENEYSDFDAFATRSQFAQIFSLALPEEALPAINGVADNSIPDVPMQSSYSGAVYKLYRAGILTGNDAVGTFAPDTNIQRSAVAAIVSRMAKQELRKTITLNVQNNQVADENSVLPPPTNIRVVNRDSDYVYIQWDEVEGADYYYIYYQQEGEDTFWYGADESTGEQMRFQYSDEYGVVFFCLKEGATYNVKMTSVKDGIESEESEIFSFVFSTTKTKLDSMEISEKCAPAVFYIESYYVNGSPKSSGSGFFITPNGCALTNFHVIRDCCFFKITTADGKIHEDVSVLDYDMENDIALLKINGTTEFPYIPIGDSDLVRQGQQVYAIGSPLGLSDTMSQGIVSNPKRTLDDNEYIQISVPVNHGSSGGALIDEYGRAIGITAAAIDIASELNLAIPINKYDELGYNADADYFPSSETYYPGFSQILDFGVFSGVKRLSYDYTKFTYSVEYDLNDFHAIGSFDAADSFENTIGLYEYFLESDDMTITQISKYETEYRWENEFMSMKFDTDSGKIIISASRTPVFYDDFPELVDLGWYFGIPLVDEPVQDEYGGKIYGYYWSDRYDLFEFAYMLYMYEEQLKETGYEYLGRRSDDEYVDELYVKDNQAILVIYSKTNIGIYIYEITDEQAQEIKNKMENG